MAEFYWKEVPPHGACNACGTSVHERGFVDFIGDVSVIRDGYEISGVVDAYYCAGCLEQAARLVGCATKQEVADLAYREFDLLGELEKTRDEVQSWQQRHEQLLGNLSEPALQAFTEETTKATEPKKSEAE